MTNVAKGPRTVLLTLLTTLFLALVGCGASPEAADVSNQNAEQTATGQNEAIEVVSTESELDVESSESESPSFSKLVWVPTQAWYANVMLVSEQSGTVTLAYDAWGNLASRTITLPGVNTRYTDTYSYDASGNVTEYTRNVEENGSYSFSSGTVTTIDQTCNNEGISVSFTEQADEAHRSQTCTHTRTYDNEGRIISDRASLIYSADNFEFVSGFTCDEHGWTTSRTTTPGGFDPIEQTVAYTYDESGFLAGYTLRDNAGNEQRFIAHTDEYGNVTEIEREDGSPYARFEYAQIEVATPGAYAASTCKDYEYTYCRDIGDSPFNLLSSAYHAI